MEEFKVTAIQIPRAMQPNTILSNRNVPQVPPGFGVVNPFNFNVPMEQKNMEKKEVPPSKNQSSNKPNPKISGNMSP